MRFVWDTKKDQGNEVAAGPDRAPGQPSLQPGSAEKPTPSLPGMENVEKHSELPRQQRDLQKFLEAREKLKDEKSRREFALRLAEWDAHGRVESMRTAGISEAIDRNDHLRKHALLSSAFLTLDSQPNQPYVFRIDFKGNQMAEWRVGLGDTLPANVLRVKLRRSDGSEVVGVRSQNPKTKRIGYFEEQALREGRYEYLAVHTGDKVEILETAEIPPQGNLRTLKEHEEVYMRGAASASSLEPEETRYNAVTGQTYSSVQAAYDARKKEVEDRSRYERQGTPLAPIKAPENQGSRFNWAQYCGSTEAQVSRFIINEDPITHKKPIRFMGVPIAGGVNRLVLPFLKEAEARIKAAGLAYKVYDMQGYNYRNVKRADGLPSDRLSQHAYAAFDINPRENQQSTEGDLPPEIVQIFESIGFTWGGSWGGATRDPMHFQLDQNPFNSASNLQTEQGKRYADLLIPKPVQTEQAQPVKSPKTGEVIQAQPLEGTNIAHHNTRNYADIAQDHAYNAEHMSLMPERMQYLNKFKNRALQNRSRYEAVAAKSGIPWTLIAALHERESSMNFNTYLHNGDPLGKPTVHVPRGVMFNDWESAASDALSRVSSIRNRFGVTENTKEMAPLLTIAEAYNGLGYRGAGKGPSPYVYAGTNIYQGGMYVADGVYNSQAQDKRGGVAAMLKILEDV